jgi:hypothetical protein
MHLTSRAESRRSACANLATNPGCVIPQGDGRLDDGICPGACNVRFRRAQAAYHEAVAKYDPLDAATSRPEPPAIRPAAGHPWCLECQAVIRHHFWQLDRLAPLRSEILLSDGYPADASPERVSGSTEDVSPSQAGDDVLDLDRVLADWEWTYRRHMGWPAAEYYGELADQRTECIVWLGARLDGILAAPMARDFGEEVLRYHADLKGKTKAGVRKLKKPLRCLSCGLLMLWYTDGERDVKCYTPHCGFQMPLDDYHATVEAVAAAGITEGTEIAL